MNLVYQAVNLSGPLLSHPLPFYHQEVALIPPSDIVPLAAIVTNQRFSLLLQFIVADVSLAMSGM